MDIVNTKDDLRQRGRRATRALKGRAACRIRSGALRKTNPTFSCNEIVRSEPGSAAAWTQAPTAGAA